MARQVNEYFGVLYGSQTEIIDGIVRCCLHGDGVAEHAFSTTSDLELAREIIGGSYLDKRQMCDGSFVISHMDFNGYTVDDLTVAFARFRVVVANRERQDAPATTPQY